MKIDNAALYEWTHRGNEGDVAWYLGLCQQDSKVLELGCGGGRISLPIAMHGCHVTGLDNDQQMLQRLQQAARKEGVVPEQLRLLQGDMRRFELHCRYDRIFLPFNTLYLLQSEQEILNCFQCAKLHLKEEGLFAFDIHCVDESISESDTPDTWYPCLVIRLPDGDISVTENRVWNLEEQKVKLTYRYEFWDGRFKEQSLTQRYLTYSQCAALIEKADLQLKQVYGDFQGGELSDDSEQMLFSIGHCI